MSEIREFGLVGDFGNQKLEQVPGGAYVLRCDHLAAVKAARIEALKEALKICNEISDLARDGYRHSIDQASDDISERIAAIEQEEPR